MYGRVSYKKQFILGIMLLLTLITTVELISRIYEFSNPPCDFVKSEIFKDTNFYSLRQSCQDHSVIKWTEEPFRQLIPNQHYPTVHVNSDGFRGAEINNDDTYRIFVVGGSTVYGSGVSDNETIPAKLEQELKAKGFYGVQVINAGVPGIHSFTEYALIKNKIIKFQPDLIVVYDGYNDLVRHFDDYYKTGEYESTAQLIRIISKNEYLRSGSVLIHTYFTLTNPRQVETFNIDTENIEKKSLAWRKTLNNICELGRESDFQTIVILQPFLGTGTKKLSNEEQQIYAQNNHKQLVSDYESYRSQVNNLISYCFITKDMTGIFDDMNDPMFFDFAHLGPTGNEIVSKKIANEIINFIKLT